MGKQVLLLLLILCFSIDLNSQSYNPLQPPNTFRQPDNPNYWKNKKPYEGYWQQDVHYTIKAEINEKTDIIKGEEQLVYWNNSPDALEYVYFHLYQNAFQPGSYYDNLQKNNKVKPRYGRYESQGLGTEILNLLVNGNKVKTELDNTILKVWLPQPLESGESVTFDIIFNTYFDGTGNVRRRMKTYSAWGYKHYNGVHWYPRISVYDRKFGWTTDQHLGKEFYGDFGTFDVELTFANNFIVEATGNLLNREEVLPPDLREKLDIKNFADKPWNSPPSVIIPYDSLQRKTWKFHAENVHDFAFTADPTYRIGETEWNGIKCIAVAQEPHASGWQNAADYTAKVIQVYSEDIGMYTYHKMIVADARDGMEYPMLTLDGGSDPGYRGLLAHEIGHNWFFGQVGNNETYRAPLDEGFTQFLTAWSLRKIDGDTMVRPVPKSKYKQKFKEPVLAKYARVDYAYLNDALKQQDPSLSTHSDGFGGALRHGGGYRHVYYKTASMLYNLQYVLGDELFLEAMQHYFAQWKIAHPYYEDLRNSFIQYTGVDLNWFFDQWLIHTKQIDYGIKSIKKGAEKDEYLITFKRKGSQQMPIDFTVTDKNGGVHGYHIPNTWFVKNTTAKVLPRWIGWDKLHPTYIATVDIPGGIKTVAIDTIGRLSDVNMLDNRSYFPVKMSFDHHLFNYPDNKHYRIFSRPDIWYNSFDGIKTGIHMNGNYMNYLHNYHLTVWFNSGLLQKHWKENIGSTFEPFSFNFMYNTALDKFMKGSSVFLQAKSLDGLQAYKAGFDKKSDDEKSRVYTYYQSMFRSDSIDLAYTLYPGEWIPGNLNNTVNVGLDHTYRYVKGKGNINLNVRTTAPGSDYSYSNISLNVINDNRLGKLRLKTRTFLQFGTGSNWAPESQLYLAGANPENLMDNKFTRSRGAFDREWTGFGSTTNHFHSGGGLNLRGYAGYLVPHEAEQGELEFLYKGESGAAFNTELEFFNPLLFKRTLRFTSYLFADAGIINIDQNYANPNFSDIRVDAGIGTALTIRRWGPLEMVKPLTIRFDMPLFLNRTPAADPDFFQFRWIMGVSRAF